MPKKASTKSKRRKKKRTRPMKPKVKRIKTTSPFCMFKVEGFFEIPCIQGAKDGRIKYIDDENIRKFWKKNDTVSKKIGCYIFCLTSSQGITPWYVGKTGRAFKDECFTARFHKDKYNNFLINEGNGRFGRPLMCFISLEKASRGPKGKKIKELEEYLIQTASVKNPELLNTAHKMDDPKWGIRGVVNSGSGKVSSDAAKFRKMMGLVK